MFYLFFIQKIGYEMQNDKKFGKYKLLRLKENSADIC